MTTEAILSPGQPPRQMTAPTAESPAAHAALSTSASANSDKHTIRAFAFAGGNFETVNQLGVIHAMIVARCAPPDLVVGISGGAVNAVTLAEVLQAGEFDDGTPNPSAQIARFRQIYEAVRSCPGEFLQELLPDLFEVDARAPLKPQSLPLNPPHERQDRVDALNAKFGLIRLFNDLLAFDLSVSRLTRMVRRFLEIKRVAEMPWYSRWWRQAVQWVSLWYEFFWVIPRVARSFGQVTIGLLFSGAYGRMLRRVFIADGIRNGMRNTIAKQILTRLLRYVGLPAPATALEIMRRSPAGRTVRRTATNMVYALIVYVLWAAAGAPIVVIAVLAVEFGAFPHDFFANFWAIAAPVAVVAAWLCGLWWLMTRPASHIPRALLASYGLAPDLATPYALKRMLVRLYDPEYYGKTDLTKVVNSVFTDTPQGDASEIPSQKKTLGYYARPEIGSRKHRIHIRALVADLKSGNITSIAPDVSLVDALLAACARVPFLRPQRVKVDTDETPNGSTNDTIYAIDALSIRNDPLFGVFSVLAREYKRRYSTIFSNGDDPSKYSVEIYPVTSLPRQAQPAETSRYDSIRTCEEALRLQRYRDADVGQTLVDTINAVLPDRAFYEVARARQEAFVYVRASVQRIRPETPDDVNDHVLMAKNEDERRHAVAMGVADGCHSALQTFLAASLREEWKTGAKQIDCCKLMTKAKRQSDNIPYPGCDPKYGPGLAEVCRACRWQRSFTNEKTDESTGTNGIPIPNDWPVWKPPGPNGDSGQVDKATSSPPAPVAIVTEQKEPQELRAALEKLPEPAAAVLFSGGVFRGVFQVGVIAALQQTDLRPRVIGGASIGSITAAMAARIFSAEKAERTRLTADLAATFLCVDRLVMTDRLSDFVREFTVRAAGTKFSLADADRFFRRYDEPSAHEYTKGARRVLAGMERLFYVDPVALLSIARAMRSSEKRSHVANQLRRAVQYFLDESGVGQELLGTEPLRLLLDHHVFGDIPQETGSFAMFEGSKRDGIRLLATVTNLTTGHLDRLGSDGDAILREGLLASSAFPGVFKPRWSWEVKPNAVNSQQYIDGGVMDNLPIGSVFEYFDDLRKAGDPSRPIGRTGRAGVPHLLFTASLEPERPELSSDEVAEVADFWFWASQRVKQLRYNIKVTDYARAMRHAREIVNLRRKNNEDLHDEQLPLDLEVVCVVPKWLCGTFAFHPMLGFRRERQARSIAHGCAMTFAKLEVMRRGDDEYAKWLASWGILNTAVPNDCVKARNQPGYETEVEAIVPRKRGTKDSEGACWLCAERKCPFSEPELRRAYGEQAIPARIREISAIHRLCGDPKTHKAPRRERA